EDCCPAEHPHASPTRRSSDLPSLLFGHSAQGPLDELGRHARRRHAPELCGERLLSLTVVDPTLDPLRQISSESPLVADSAPQPRSEEHTSELQSRENLVCRLV